MLIGAATGNAEDISPSLQCPDSPVPDEYGFAWDAGGYAKSITLEFSSSPDFGKKKRISATKTNPAPVLRVYKNLIKFEAESGRIYARITAKSDSGQIGSSEVCEFTLVRPEEPELSCPASPVDKEYAFSWSGGGYGKSAALELSADSGFGRKTGVKVKTPEPVPIESKYKTLLSYYSKQPLGDFYARINAKDNYKRAAYSNTCNFELDSAPACTQNSDCGTDGFSGGGVCKDGDQYGNYYTYTCRNPGTSSAQCTSTKELRVKLYCNMGCSNGTCTTKVVTFKNMPDTITTNMAKFPVLDEFTPNWRINANGEVFREGAYYPFALVDLEEGSNTITFEESDSAGSWREVAAKTVIYDPEYSTEGARLVYATAYKDTYHSPDLNEDFRYILVVDLDQGSYFGAFEHAEVLGISRDGGALIARFDSLGNRVVFTNYNRISDIVLDDFGYYSGLEYSRDGSRFYADRGIYDADNFQKTGDLENPVGYFSEVSLDDRGIFYNYGDYGASYYSLQDSNTSKTFVGDFSYYDSGLVESNDGKYLVRSGCSYEIGFIEVFSIATGERIKKIDYLPDCEAELGFSPDGKALYYVADGQPGEASGTVIFDASNFTQKALIGNAGDSHLEFTEDGTMITAGSGGTEGLRDRGIMLFKPSGFALEKKKVFFVDDIIDEWVGKLVYKPAS